MRTLRDVALSIENRKQITVLGLDRWLLQEFDQACSELPEHTTYSPPNPSLRGTTHLIDGILRECLDSALYICAAFRSQRPGIDLGTVIVMKSAASALSNSIINLHIMIESAASEFRATKSYLDCLRLTSHLRRPQKFIPYRDLEGRGMKIEAKNLHFGYSDQDKEVLTNISFKIHAGETIGIVGYNGYHHFPASLTSGLGNLLWLIFCVDYTIPRMGKSSLMGMMLRITILRSYENISLFFFKRNVNTSSLIVAEI